MKNKIERSIQDIIVHLWALTKMQYILQYLKYITLKGFEVGKHIDIY